MFKTDSSTGKELVGVPTQNVAEVFKKWNASAPASAKQPPVFSMLTGHPDPPENAPKASSHACKRMARKGTGTDGPLFL